MDNPTGLTSEPTRVGAQLDKLSHLSTSPNAHAWPSFGGVGECIHYPSRKPPTPQSTTLLG